MDNDKNSSKRYKGLPAQSYEMLVIDYGYGSGIESNIYIATDPLAEQFGYVTTLRTITSGRATSTMEFHSYEEIPNALAKNLVNSIFLN